ncbi:hypothetical protein G6O67_006618 [Ophiocordyceps sinensis]|uniref:Peptidase M60 domain-containing protein n=1 Tax=Ophiocordyceps sinensis TaxID=72228 RepID=A0A8H4PN49_9HYPO|nr:hypothetical protein G6O67_006618 [Ophiocordyceps sinensis]
MHHTWQLLVLGLGAVSPCLGSLLTNQVILATPLDDAPQAKVVLESTQDSTVFYPDQKQAIWPKVWNKGPGKADKLVLESVDLRPWNLSIVEVYAYCPGTRPGSPRIECEWSGAAADFYKWSKITLKFKGPAGKPIDIRFKLTSYVKDAASGTLKLSDQATFTHHWGTRAAPAYHQTDLSTFPQPRTVTVSAVPDAEGERARLKQRFKWADFQPTGFYLNPGAPLTVRVSGVSGAGPEPQLLIGTPALAHPDHRNELLPALLQPSQPLRNGLNTVSSPFGGIVYVRYVQAAGQTAPPVVITLAEGPAAQPFPLFRQGVTTNQEWKAMLVATKVPFAEQAGRRVIVTGFAADARIYANKGQDQEALLDTYARIIGAQDSISALSFAAPDARDKPSPLRPLVVQSRDNNNPNAFHYRVAIPSRNHDITWSQPVLEKSWMMWHELGHHRQHTSTWSWGAMGEVTVNIYSLAARRLVPDIPSEHGTVKEWNDAKTYLAQDASKKDFDAAGHFVRLAMFEQLRVNRKVEPDDIL